jgi:hypothetical protein
MNPATGHFLPVGQLLLDHKACLGQGQGSAGRALSSGVSGVPGAAPAGATARSCRCCWRRGGEPVVLRARGQRRGSILLLRGRGREVHTRRPAAAKTTGRWHSNGGWRREDRTCGQARRGGSSTVTPCDEDITTSDTTTPSIEVQGPIMIS